jgi:3alpha(or 20beta)-hydroxysteroid dehydrogenase
MGAAEARLFVDEGARVVIGDVLDAEGEVLAKDLGVAAVYRHLDVTSEDQWTEVVGDTIKRWGGVDVLINNAGIVKLAPIVMTTLEDYRAVIRVNQEGPFLGMKAVIPPMLGAGRGSIVNISSVDGMHGTPGIASYVASKFAVRGMTKVAALELGAFGIRVNSIHPGAIKTPMIDPPEFQGVDVAGAVAKQTALQRIGESHEVAETALFLASDASSYCTGAEFVVDGGLTAGVAVAPIGEFVD